MQNFISTDTIVLISLLGKKIPNVLNYIFEFSTTKSGKATVLKPTLSSQRIQEACKHPSGIISQTLNTLITAQSLLNAINTKINKLTKQRTLLENTIVTLLTNNDKTKG